MEPRRVRLGDVLDDYCPRCRLLMNHGVVGMVGDEVRKVRCNTCLSEHVYKHGKVPTRRRSAARKKLFDEVLKGLSKTPGEPSDDPTTEPERPAEPEPPAEAAAEPEPEAPRPAFVPHRKLYTIRRAIAKKNSGKDPDRS